MAKKSIPIEKHILMPKQSVCSEKENQAILEKYNATLNEMPRISITDAALSNLRVKVKDRIKVERDDELIGKNTFFRVVIDE